MKVYGRFEDNLVIESEEFIISSGFVRWIIIANIIAWPLAFWVMDQYFLSNFAYNTGIQWWIFAISLLFSLLIAILVVLTQVHKVGRLNPAEYIRYE
jgi:putative ABC transport system permease protein